MTRDALIGWINIIISVCVQRPKAEAMPIQANANFKMKAQLLRFVIIRIDCHKSIPPLALICSLCKFPQTPVANTFI
jgi:hypothetical protein